MRREDGRLPDVPAIRAAMAAVGDPFTLRGVEITAVGTLQARGGARWLRLSTEEEVSLAPLGVKIQWDPKEGRAAALTPAERRAYDALLRAGRASPLRVRVTGPLREGGRLEVRRFTMER